MEVEITPEMVEAGLKEYALFDSQDPGEHVVCAIFSAMSRARLAKRDRRVIIGVAPPPGLRWEFLGKWPDGRTEDILREMGELS